MLQEHPGHPDQSVHGRSGARNPITAVHVGKGTISFARAKSGTRVYRASTHRKARVWSALYRTGLQGRRVAVEQ